jgi:DNA-binding transcriptional LysR family regulator
MAKIVQWESQIGRRLRLRDLFVFFTVLKSGSMARAAAELGVATPSVSEVIGDLEHALGVRLLDRSPRGVHATPYGQALLRRGSAAYAEWIMPGPQSWGHTVAAEAFRARGLDMPKISVRSLSGHLQANLLANGDFVTVIARSVLHFYRRRFALKQLPIKLSAPVAGRNRYAQEPNIEPGGGALHRVCAQGSGANEHIARVASPKPSRIAATLRPA